MSIMTLMACQISFKDKDKNRLFLRNHISSLMMAFNRHCLFNISMKTLAGVLLNENVLIYTYGQK